MEDTFTFFDLLTWLSPLLAALWLWGLRRVLRDLRLVSRTGPDVARCGLPREPLGRSPPPLGMRHAPQAVSRPRAA